MTNTDKQGNFVLNGVPAGGVLIQIRRNGQIIAEGSGVFPGGALGTPQVLQIGLAPPPVSTKTAPQGTP